MSEVLHKLKQTLPLPGWPDIQIAESNNIVGKVDDSGYREEGMGIYIYNFMLWLTEPFFLSCISNNAS